MIGEHEAYCQPCVSPVWDTALTCHALIEAGGERALPEAKQGLDWLKPRQILDLKGDWAVKSPTTRPGGWAFQYNNAYYPDLDVTAVVVAVFAFTICASGVYWFPDNGYSINHQACITVTVTTATILSNNPSSSDWTVLSGTWTQQSGVMDGSGNYPEIKSTNSFAAARTVTVRARSITTGPNGWNTAWIRAKYIDDNNKITVFLKTDGCLEMDYKQNGVITYYASSQSTGQSPTAWHTFNVIFSGNNIKVQLDGVTYFDLTNSAFGTFGAANVVLTSSSSESQFDSLTIS